MVCINCHQAADKRVPTPLPNPKLIPVAAVLKKKKRGRVAKREKEPAVAHDALRLISLKNTLDTKTIWENMYSVIEKAAVIEKISVYFFIVVVIIIIIFIFYYFFFSQNCFLKKYYEIKWVYLTRIYRFSLLVWGLANTFAI